MPDAGRAWVYGDDIDTDRLFPGRYLFCVTDDEMRAHALEDLDDRFRTEVRPGDIVVGGRNFGCGSSREQAVACLRVHGVRSVIAASFARIYSRNAVNNGVAPIVCPDAAAALRDGDRVTVDPAAGTVRRGDDVWRFEPLPPFLQDILDAGGLVPHLRRQVEAGAIPA